MIEHLHITNVALIKEVEIDFLLGLNILSGETGAGKSMVIDSINFLVGGKVDKDFIRTGSEEATVEGIFIINNEDVKKAIIDMGINIESDDAILISRTIGLTSRGSIKINGKTSTISMLKEISKMLIDIHGQHEHQSLLNQSKHIELLDKFCSNDLEKNKEKLNSHLKEYREIIKNIKEITKGGSTVTERLDFINFQIEEIEEAKLKQNEEEELINRRKLLANSEKIINNTTEAINILYGFDGSGVSDRLAMGLKLIEDIAVHDSNLGTILSQISNVSEILFDTERELRRYFETLDHDPKELENVDKRLELIHSLKRKYGNTIEAVLSHYEKIKKEQDFIINAEELLVKYNLEKKKLNTNIVETCDKITKIREKEAIKIQNDIESNLKELGMKNAKFKIDVSKKTEFSSNGNDRVEFLISANQGEELKSLSKIASGGEMSRVMLSLKTVLSKADNIETFIFDEIDTGVSGRTAQKVAEKLAFISKKQQILCVSHLPQIAAMADGHFLIEKKSDKGKTLTNVFSLNYENIVKEIARLLGGAEITEATTVAAKELKDMATNFKKS